MTAPTPAVLTPERLAELEQMREAASEGTWEHEHNDYGDEWWFGGTSGSGEECINGVIVTDHDHAADAALIVAAVNSLPDLIAEVRRLTAVVQRVEALAEEYEEWAGTDNDGRSQIVRKYSSDLRAALAGES